jgi:hypothetical protein
VRRFTPAYAACPWWHAPVPVLVPGGSAGTVRRGACSRANPALWAGELRAGAATLGAGVCGRCGPTGRAANPANPGLVDGASRLSTAECPISRYGAFMLPVGQITAGGGADLLFWPISRGVLGEWVNGAGKIHRLRSLVAYQILFGGKLVIRDSDYLNSHALRAAINATLGRRPDADAKFFRALMDEGFLMIAKRQENSLGQVAEQLSRLGGSDRIDPKWYCSDAPDILYLETFHARTGLVVPFSVQDASSYYTDEIRRMLSASLQPYVDEDFRMRAATRVEDHLAEHEKLAWSFFTSDGEFWTGFSETDRRRYADFIYYVLGQAPHAGFIPDNIGIKAIYMQDAADAISIWRGRHLQTRELVDERTVPLGHGFSFSDYLEYLGRLPVDRLVSLAEGEEREEFRLTCSKFAL